MGKVIAIYSPFSLCGEKSLVFIFFHFLLLVTLFFWSIKSLYIVPLAQVPVNLQLLQANEAFRYLLLIQFSAV